MQNTVIYRRRIRRFIDRVMSERYGEAFPLTVTYTYDKVRPIPYEQLEERKWKSISPGKRWGELWSSAWFRIEGTVPESFAGSEVVALIDLGSEGCIFRDGTPYQGLTDVPRTGKSGTGKRRVTLFETARGGESVDLLVEAGANAIMGYYGAEEFVLQQADLAVFRRDRWQLGLDLEFLFDLCETLPEKSVRSRRILDGLNRAVNVWAAGRGAEEAAAICKELYKPRANASATTAWSVGHAHLDLGWLWPVRETRRKAGRTFSTALRLSEEYPDYVFGASQPQAFAWVKEDYPRLYEQIKTAVSEGRWECQGAMWVEPDMNIPSGESLVRQLLYGKRFFREEFGKEITNLWLPDVFGYSAALPQILKLAGVDYFMTQKISWNESNLFPHHTFDWEGIDGTRIRTHFLPMNTYNSRNVPRQFAESEERFAQADVSNDWLNLYGIGDGGGGPSRTHIENALRARDTEGLPRVRLAPAEEFFKRIGKIPAERLPTWRGELYLELHRGTYTTQARTKKLNRQLELTLRDAEFFAAMAGLDQREVVRAVWKDTLLNQFHDILPGSSIGLVYEDAEATAAENLAKLHRLTNESLVALHGRTPGQARNFVLYNTLSWTRDALVLVPWSEVDSPGIRDLDDTALVVQRVEDGVLVPVSIPSMGYTGITAGGEDEPAAVQNVGSRPLASGTPAGGRWSRERIVPVRANEAVLENALLRVELASDGTVASMYDKEHQREVLAGCANRFLLWEDLPYNWDAWDISHYYRETEPEQAVLADRALAENGPLRAVVKQSFTVGSSTIEQRIVLEAESRLLRIENHVTWNEKQKQLRVQAEPAIQAFEASYEIQFGTVRRPTHGNTTWDAAQFEVAGQRFCDYSQPDYGLGMVNDSKYGHSIRDGIMDLTLLRSPQDPDPHADIGEHEFVFGYYPHTLGWETSDLLEQAHELNSPVLVRPVRNLPEAAVSEFAVADGTVKLDTVKRAEDSDDIVVRLYETRGGNQEIILRSRREIARMEEVNLVEDGGHVIRGVKKSRASGFASEGRLSFGPYQIRTLRISFNTPE